MNKCLLLQPKMLNEAVKKKKKVNTGYILVKCFLFLFNFLIDFISHGVYSQKLNSPQYAFQYIDLV